MNDGDVDFVFLWCKIWEVQSNYTLELRFVDETEGYADWQTTVGTEAIEITNLDRNFQCELKNSVRLIWSAISTIFVLLLKIKKILMNGE